jgi:hypothetical protein
MNSEHTISATINGKAFTRQVEGRLLLSDFLTARAGAHRHPRGLRAGRVRGMHDIV